MAAPGPKGPLPQPACFAEPLLLPVAVPLRGGGGGLAVGTAGCLVFIVAFFAAVFGSLWSCCCRSAIDRVILISGRRWSRERSLFRGVGEPSSALCTYLVLVLCQHYKSIYLKGV